MPTLNPNDEINAAEMRTILKKRREDLRDFQYETKAAQTIAQKFDLVPRRQPHVIKAMRDERQKVSCPRDMFEADPATTFGRRQELVYFKEISKEEAMELTK